MMSTGGKEFKSLFPDINKKEQSKIVSILQDSKVKNIFCCNKWNLERKQFKKRNWKYLFKHLKKSICHELCLHSNALQSFPAQLSSIQFSQLKQLNLGFNNITSVESIIFLNSPKIKILFIAHNKINELKSLRKCVSIGDSLNELFLHNNSINQVQMFEYNLSKQIIRLAFEFQESQLIIQNDFSPVFKIGGKKIVQISKSEQRIKVSKCYQMFLQKHKDALIRYA